MRRGLTLTVLGTVSAIVAACDNTNQPASPSGSSTSTGTTAPDNTARNRVDRESSAAQSPSQSDVTIAAAIRRNLVNDNTLSTDAQNCKIVVQNGAVTLQGRVKTQAEKDMIESRAKAVPGVTSVDNQLEVK
jgi:osmotically-inducible protein OsmY